MADEVLVAERQGLSQIERVVDTFVAPTKTFTDILRSRSWWLPLLIYLVVSAGFAFAVDQKIGFDSVAEQAVQQSSIAQSQLDSLSPEMRSQAIHRQAVRTKYTSYVGGIFFLVFALFGALLNWATINFGFGAKTTFGQNFTLQMYSSLPLAIKSLISIVLVFAGVGTDNFNMRDPVGTNPGFYMTDAAAWVKTFLTFFDVFGLWALALAVIGLACISGKSKGSAAIVVVGWWFVFMIVITGLVAAFS
jgi:hypothetical protein